MKKILFLMVAALFAISGNVNAQVTKSAKSNAKRMAKEGWYSGDYHSMEEHFTAFDALAKENYTFTGKASGCEYEKVAKNLARRDAMRGLVEEASTVFKGGASELEGKVDKKTLDDITAASVSKFEGKVSDGVKTKFFLFKKEGAYFGCTAYCYIEKKVVEQAKKSAWQEALEEAAQDTKAAQVFTDEVKNLINAYDF